MKEIIITGASGFVGKNLSRYLAQKGFKIVPVSLRNPDWKSKFSSNAFAVIHLAGLTNKLERDCSKEEFVRINSELTNEVFQMFNQSNGQKFIFVSSIKAVLDSPGDLLIDENQLPNPQTKYGQSKLLAEQELLKHHLPNKFLYILRPAMIHGPENKGNLYLLYKLVKKGIPYPLGGFLNERSFLSVDNLNFIVDELLHSEIESGVFNLADTDCLSTVEVIHLIGDTIGKKPRIWSLNKRMITVLAQVGSFFFLPFNTNRLKKLTESYKVSNAKILQLTGKNMPFTAKEGIRNTISSFK